MELGQSFQIDPFLFKMFLVLLLAAVATGLVTTVKGAAMKLAVVTFAVMLLVLFSHKLGDDLSGKFEGVKPLDEVRLDEP